MEQSLVLIFYNFIPGVIFLTIWLFLLDKISLFSTNNLHGGVLALIFISFALLNGFSLHGISRVIRKFLQIERWIINKVASENREKGYFREAKKYIIEIFGYRGLTPSDSEIFHDSNLVTWVTNKEHLYEFFASRATLFVNMALGSLITLIILFIRGPNNVSNNDCTKYTPFFLLSILAAFVFSGLYYYYKKTSIDVAIKSMAYLYYKQKNP